MNMRIIKYISFLSPCCFIISSNYELLNTHLRRLHTDTRIEMFQSLCPNISNHASAISGKAFYRFNEPCGDII